MLVREMLDDEVEDVILTEYEKFGNSIFAELSMTDFNKKVLVAEKLKGFAIVFWNDDEFYIGRIFAENSEVEKTLLEKCIVEASKMNFKEVLIEVPVEEDITKLLAFGFIVKEIVKHRYGICKHAFKLSYQI